MEITAAVSRVGVEILQSKILPDLDAEHNHIIDNWGMAYLSIPLDYNYKTKNNEYRKNEGNNMAFFTTTITTLKTVVTALGAGVAVWGVVNLLEGYGNDNPGAKSQGMKQLMAGGGIVIIAQTVIPQLSTLFS